MSASGADLPPTATYPKDRRALDGFGETILDILADHTTDKEWGEWLKAPFERATRTGDVSLSIALFTAGTTGNHLHAAVRGDHRNLVNKLLEHGASPTAQDDQGDAPLHVGASSGRSHIVETLVAIKEVDKDGVNGKGLTPLHLASMSGDVPTVLALVAAGANVRLRLGGTRIGYTAFDLATRSSGGHAADVKSALRKHGVVGKTRGFNLDGEVLHAAAMEDNVHMINYLIVDEKVDVNFVNIRGSTPLHTAALKGASRAMTTLIAHGANTGALDKDDQTPLQIAAKDGHVSAIDVLCAAGVDVNRRVPTQLSYAPENDDWSALDCAAHSGNVGALKALVHYGADLNAISSEGLTLLNTAAAGNKVEMIDILIGLGLDVEGSHDNNVSSRHTPLYTATSAHSAEAVRALARHGANLHKVDGIGNTPLQSAIMWCHSDMGVINALLKGGADPNFGGHGTTPLFTIFERMASVDALRALVEGGADISARMADGEYPLHHAVRSSFDVAEMVQVLAEAGADVDCKSIAGLTPLHIACSRARRLAVAALLRHGAAVDVVDGDGDSPLHLAAVSEGRGGSWRSCRRVSGCVNLLLKADADEKVLDNDGYTPYDRVLSELWDTRHHENVKVVLRWLEQAPADRAWRRRALWVMCRAYPNRARFGPEMSGAKLARMAEGREFSAAAEDNGGGWGGGGRSGAQGGASASGAWRSLASRLLGLHEEGIFRAVVSFL